MRIITVCLAVIVLGDVQIILISVVDYRIFATTSTCQIDINFDLTRNNSSDKQLIPLVA